MKVSLRQLKRMRVETKSGLFLGRVKDMVMQTEGQQIVQYVVSKMFREHMLISRDQIIRFEEHKIIVEDNVVKERGVAFDKKTVHRVEPVAMRDADI